MPAKKSEALDLKLDSLAPLRWPHKLIVDDVAVSVQSLPMSAAAHVEQEGRLRFAAAEGNAHALVRLGLLLTDDKSSQAARDEGLALLRRSADSGDPFAMMRLAQRLLDKQQSVESIEEAEQWLMIAIDHGNAMAGVILGTRLIMNTGLARDLERGKNLMEKAAYEGSQLAHIKLGAYLMSGRGLAQNREEAYRWLRRIGVTQSAQLSLVSQYLYMKSLAAPVRSEAQQLAEEAGILFHESALRGNDAAKVNLAYLIRRGEIAPAPYPSLDLLLAAHLQQGKPFALANQALRLAKGIDCEIDWNLADILVSKILSASGVQKWWGTRSSEGDPEGHLVVGWLARHRLTLNGNQPLASRMRVAREGGWDAPEWMDVPIAVKQEHSYGVL